MTVSKNRVEKTTTLGNVVILPYPGPKNPFIKEPEGNSTTTKSEYEGSKKPFILMCPQSEDWDLTVFGLPEFEVLVRPKEGGSGVKMFGRVIWVGPVDGQDYHVQRKKYNDQSVIKQYPINTRECFEVWLAGALGARLDTEVLVSIEDDLERYVNDSYIHYMETGVQSIDPTMLVLSWITGRKKCDRTIVVTLTDGKKVRYPVRALVSNTVAISHLMSTMLPRVVALHGSDLIDVTVH